MKSPDLKQRSAPTRTDLREMLRQHIVSRSLACMEAAEARREPALASPAALTAYRAAIRAAASPEAITTAIHDLIAEGKCR